MVDKNDAEVVTPTGSESKTQKRIFAISGSTRKDSTNMLIIKAIAGLYQHDFEISIYEKLADLPFFNPDAGDDNVHPGVAAFREEIDKSDGVLICTPEYVFSVPAILKNALEWTVATTVFSEKPTVLITASLSGEKTHESLLLIMKTLGARIDPGCELLIKGARTKINAAGEFTSEVVAEQIAGVMSSFQKVLE